MTLRSSISFICRLLALWLVVHAVPPVHAQDASPPSAAGVDLQPRAAGNAYARSQAPLDAPRRSPWLLQLGLVIFTVGYVPSAVFGAIQPLAGGSDEPSTCARDCRASRFMFIPLAGPWLALLEEGRGAGFAVLGALQDLGFALALIGAFVRARSDSTRGESQQSSRFAFAATPMPGGARLALRLTL